MVWYLGIGCYNTHSKCLSVADTDEESEYTSDDEDEEEGSDHEDNGIDKDGDANDALLI